MYGNNAIIVRFWFSNKEAVCSNSLRPNMAFAHIYCLKTNKWLIQQYNIFIFNIATLDSKIQSLKKTIVTKNISTNKITKLFTVI